MENSIEKERELYVCSKCGTIVSSKLEEKKCIYCDEKVNVSYKLKSNVKYNYVIPFKHSKEEIVNIIKHYIKRRPLFPKEFNIKHNIKNIKSIFIPLWVFDFEARGEVEVEASKISKFKSNSKKYQKTDLYQVTVGGNMAFNNVTLLTSKKITEEIIDGLNNYDYTKQVEFEEKYIDGVLIEEQDMKIKDIISLGENNVKDMFTSKLMDEIKDYNELEPKENTINLRNTKKTCILLPIWILNIKYKEKIYELYVNGQTGKVMGEIPISYKKLIFKLIFTFIFVFILLFFLFNYKVIL